MYQLNPEKEQDINNIFILTSYFNIGKIFLKCDITHKTFFIQLFYIGFYIFISHGKMEIDRVEFWFFTTHALLLNLFTSDLSLCLSIFLWHALAFIHSYTQLKAIHIDLIWSDELPKWWESVAWKNMIDPHQKMENDDVNGYQRLPMGGLFRPLGVQPLVIFSQNFWTIKYFSFISLISLN